MENKRESFYSILTFWRQISGNYLTECLNEPAYIFRNEKILKFQINIRKLGDSLKFVLQKTGIGLEKLDKRYGISQRKMTGRYLLHFDVLTSIIERLFDSITPINNTPAAISCAGSRWKKWLFLI